MNRFDKLYDIAQAGIEDIPSIMDFIESQWRHDHILARSREFFEYEHVIDGYVNFIIARNRNTNDLDGIIGFIQASKDKDHLDIWSVLWKTRPGAMPLLGMELIDRVNQITECRNHMGIGDNPNTAVPLLKLMKKDLVVVKLDHYYLLSDREMFRIATIRKRPEIKVMPDRGDIVVKEIKNAGMTSDYVDYADHSVYPYKDEWYIDHRYFSHPIYKYLVYGIRKDEHSALIIMRIQEHGGARALRIVDYIGDQKCLSWMRSFFADEMKEYDCEYVDFYVSGFDDKYIYEAGFTKIEENDENVIPDYFNPFVNENIDIWADGMESKCLYCKADGDQDRPC